MNKKLWLWVLLFAIILSFCILYKYLEFINNSTKITPTNTLSIAAWNLQIFGDKKANNTELMSQYAEFIKYYDIFFVQEIRDKDGSAFDELCKASKTQYAQKCIISSRAGRSSSKEQYGLIYMARYTLVNFTDYNPDPLDRWERPPIRADFEYKNYSFSVYLIHTKPDDVKNEISNLEDLISKQDSKSNIIILGDLNADCNYYDESKKDFNGWNWIISDDDDTTATNSNCAYDRIVLNSNASDEYSGYSIDKRTNSALSDHYPISVTLRNKESSKPSFATFIRTFFD